MKVFLESNANVVCHQYFSLPNPSVNDLLMQSNVIQTQQKYCKPVTVHRLVKSW